MIEENKTEFDETMLIQFFTDYLRHHDKGVGIFNPILSSSGNLDDVKNMLRIFIKGYFYETNLLLRLSEMGLVGFLGIKKTIDKLPNKPKYKDIKDEGTSQYDKMSGKLAPLNSKKQMVEYMDKDEHVMIAAYQELQYAMKIKRVNEELLEYLISSLRWLLHYSSKNNILLPNVDKIEQLIDKCMTIVYKLK